MRKEDRIKGLVNLHATGEKKLINYKGVKNIYDVFNIPLKYLIYNPYNGRIKAISKSWENTNHKLSPENDEDALIIEQFLWDSAENRNKQTKASILEYGQIEAGIVTKDGVIIDGNRRASIINVINREEKLDLNFRAIILPDELHENEREIIQLETVYQMGVDNKVDYNPIEKYLRCQELIDLEFSIKEISKMLAVSEIEVNKWLEILKLMNEYLGKYGYNKMFVALEKREGHFVDLMQYLRSYNQGVGRDYANWNYGEGDLYNLKEIYNDFTRLRFPVQNCRIIANPSKGQSFFCHEEIWQPFESNHYTIVEEVHEDALDIYIERTKQGKIQNIIADRDELWRKKVKGDLIDNLYTSKRVLEDKLKYDEPLKKLKTAQRTINSIELIDVQGKKSSELDDISDQIIDGVSKIMDANNS